MSRPRFLADEDLRFEIVLGVRRLEPAVEFPRAIDQGLARATDHEVLEYADTRGLLVVSHDVNTMMAAAVDRLREGPGISGLFLVPQNRPTRSVAEALLLIWAASEAEEWRDKIVYLPL